ncbi:PcfJ domain-containing protein [uncultured Oscillibacter sp.]|uniref:PcfJ domain-containing protein n=1 Tax=Anaerotruncus sp. 1XD42-93 TaxID=2320853 RepID=UPI000EA2FC3B|nr:PcfJ domain-containing protein [uncultured Oscillibacter sp.]NBK19157.1 hypothetical protein [Anaerotruncus sp. 1XD42-93]RKJ82483.1 hypothetical protein D7Y41_23755 [Anaerotruncus sp. 1XD22-93]
MEQIDYTPLLPKTPPVDLIQWALEQDVFQKEYLIYKASRIYEPLEDQMRPAVEVVCTHCGKKFFAEKVDAGGCSVAYAPAPFGWYHHEMSESVISGSITMCPVCGCDVKVVHIGSIPRGIEDCAWITTMSRLPIEERQDRFVLADWLVKRKIAKSGDSQYTTDPYSAWVVEEKKVVRLMGYMRTLGGSISILHKWAQRKTFCDVYGEASMVYPWDKSLLEGTTAENCKLDLYQDAEGKRLVAYLALWRKRPTVENLLVQGCGRFLAELIDKERSCGSDHGGIPKLKDVNWKEKRPAQMLGLNKEEFRYMQRMRWDVEDLERYRLAKTSGLPLKLPEDMKLLRSKPAYEINRILTDGFKKDFWRILRYLKNQKGQWYTLQDYWNMAQRLHRDLSDSLVRWPRSLKAAHDQVMAEQKAREDAALNEMFIERAEELQYLSFELNGLLIRPCQNETELIREGKDLHHCVATYAKRHAEGKTAILFIRQVAEPNIPFFTLEFDEETKTVRQNRGLRNCGRTPEVTAFETAWLNHVRHVRPKERTKIA